MLDVTLLTIEANMIDSVECAAARYCGARWQRFTVESGKNLPACSHLSAPRIFGKILLIVSPGLSRRKSENMARLGLWMTYSVFKGCPLGTTLAQVRETRAESHRRQAAQGKVQGWLNEQSQQ